MRGIPYNETVGFDWNTRIVAELSDNSKYVFGDPDDPNNCAIDSRLRLITKTSDLFKLGMFKAYRQYVAAFAELTNDNPQCLPARYSACGFLPVGVEPESYVNQINNQFIIPKLHEMGLEYFLLPPMSPVSTSYKPMDKMASTHDVWVGKMEAAKVVHKPIHNITTLDLLEVILPS